MAVFIDPITGCTSLDEAQAAKLLEAGSIADLEFASGLLRSLMHESTHHASLIGKVGCAYAALCIGGAARAPAWTQPSSLGAISLQTRDWLAYQFCASFYGPVLEGLALFAEYDLCSNAVTVESAPLQHAKSLYLEQAFKDAVSAACKVLEAGLNSREPERLIEEVRTRREKYFNDILRGHRLTAEAKALKAKLLSQPLTDPKDGAALYLFGYLAIKGLYRYCRRFAPFRMTTLFHLAVQQALFSDDLIAEQLLRIDDLDLLSVQATLLQLKERIQDIVEDIASKPSAAIASLESIERGQSTRELDPHLQIMCGMRTAIQAPAWWPNYIGNRHILRHACTPVRFTHEEQVTTILAMDGSKLGSCPRVSKADTEEAGSIELVQTPQLEHQALVVLGTHGLIAVRCLRRGVWNLAEQVDAFDDLPSALPALALMRGRVVPQVLEDCYSAEVVDILAKIAESNKDFRSHVLANMAFLGMDRRARERACDILSTAGFASLFGREDLLELAEYSLVFGGEGLSIEEGCALLGRTEIGCRRRLDTFNDLADKALGTSLFEVTFSHAIAFI